MGYRYLALKTIKRNFSITVLVLVLALGLLFIELGQQWSRAHYRKTVLQVMTHTSSPKNRTRRGYMMALNYWEQLTSASRNLFGLQCWAGTLKMTVVTPAIQKSYLKTQLNHKQENSMMFSDFYDIDYWNKMSVQKGYAVLESWEAFFQEASRNVIAVDIVFSNKKKRIIRACPNKPAVATYLRNTINFNFNIVREVCVSVDKYKSFTMEEINDLVFGSHQPWNSTVILNEWRGFHNILLEGSPCTQISAHKDAMPSKQVWKDAKAYQKEYFNSSNYISIMVRMEKAKIFLHKKKGVVPYCYQKTLQYWEKLVQETGLKKTFISSDTGKFGSHTFKTTGDKSTPSDELSNFFKGIYADQLSVQDWEDSFVKVSGTTEAGYISMLQKVVAVQAKCILFVGGGSYQMNSFQLYNLTHNLQHRCHHIVPNCTRNLFFLHYPV